ncbi:MAG TPA: sialidase family protein [Burkholderiales bacterium]
MIPSVFARAVALLMLMLASWPAFAHDPSAWGGLFRSRDLGETWFPSDAGLFIGAALAVAIDPKDPNHLLYGTDTRLLRSRNGGRDWTTEAPSVFPGAVFAVAFDADGAGALASSGTRIFRTDDGAAWQDVMAPGGAAPVRAFASGAGADRVYLAGAHGLFTSDSRGRAWQRAGEGVLPDSAVRALLVIPGTPDRLFAVIDGRLWMGGDQASWRAVTGLPDGKVETLSRDAAIKDRLWGFAADQVFVSDDLGGSWKPHGQPLADPGTSVRGIAASADGKIIVLSTHRGAWRSKDDGTSWYQIESNLPVHLESGMLIRDPREAATLYAGFSLNSYGEMYRVAEQGGSTLAHLDPFSLAGAGAFLVLLIVLGSLSVRWLARVRA